MNRIISGLILSALISLHACGPNLVAENKKLRDDLLVIHDEVMPQMGKLKSLEKKANQKVEQLSAIVPIDSIQVQKFSDLAQELSGAYEGMFVWMRQYEAEDGEKDPLLVKSYLEEQMIQVKEVNQDIKNILQVAEKDL